MLDVLVICGDIVDMEDVGIFQVCMKILAKHSCGNMSQKNIKEVIVLNI